MTSEPKAMIKWRNIVLSVVVAALFAHAKLLTATKPKHQFPSMTSYGSEVLKRVYDEIRRGGCEVRVRRMGREVTLFAEGFDLIERVRVRTDERKDYWTLVLERSEKGVKLQHHAEGIGVFAEFDILDENNYSPFLLGREASGYFVIPEVDLGANSGPLKAPPVRIGKQWVGERTQGGREFLDSYVVRVGEGATLFPRFYGEPKLLDDDTYLVQRDEKGTSWALVSQDDPGQYSIEFRSVPEDDGNFWRVHLAPVRPGKKTPKYAFINKHNVTQSIGFNTVERVGDDYLLKAPEDHTWLVDGTDVTMTKHVLADDGKNLVYSFGRNSAGKTYRFAQRTNPSNLSLEFEKKWAVSDGAYLVDGAHGKGRYLVSIDDVTVHSLAFAKGPWHDGDKWIVQTSSGRFYSIPKNNLRVNVLLGIESIPDSARLMKDDEQ